MINQCYSQSLFVGKKVLITGATSGIGACTAHLLASLGASLFLVGRSADKLSELISTLANAASHCSLTVDLSVPSSLYQNASALSSFGPFDGIFHSAGNGLIKPVKLINSSDITHVINPAFLAAIDIGKIASSKTLMNDGASVVLMSSVAAVTGTSCMTLYSASKGAINSFARSLAVELAPKRIRVNALVAGAVVTPLHVSMTKCLTSDMIDDYRQRHPLGMGSVEDVASSAAFLLSPLSRWITGTSLIVDGGYSAQ